MWITIGGICGFGLLLGAALWLAKNNGKKAAQLDILKEKAKRVAEEQERAHEIENNVNDMSISNVRRRLQDAKNK